MMRVLLKYLIFLITVFLGISCEEDLPPSCKILSPSDGSEIYTGALIEISIQANDSENDLTEVRVYINDDLISLSQAPLYSYIWNTE